MKIDKILFETSIFLTFFLPISVVFLSAWYLLIDGKLYYCSDKVPLLDFIPPFVHEGLFGDYFIASPLIVYAVWFGFILMMLLIPYLLTKRFFQERHH